MKRVEIYAYPHKLYNDGLSEFCIIYEAETEIYAIEIETLLGFDDTKGPQNHIRDILSDFLIGWMKTDIKRMNLLPFGSISTLKESVDTSNLLKRSIAPSKQWYADS